MLLSRMMTPEGELSEVSDSPPAAAVVNAYPSPPDQSFSRADSSFDEERLRQIIREELDAYSFAIASSSSEDQYVAPVARDPMQDQEQLDNVAEQLQYYSSVGTISNSEMARLQMDIGRLDEAGRRDMLRKLTQAMNSGAIKGHF